ncbi:MAG TPA: hypothetical protein PLA12_00010 [Candidatus Hydrogenedens sp.]|nr:hypothetical protein [Candidatus Hydrogenedens sp.]
MTQMNELYDGLNTGSGGVLESFLNKIIHDDFLFMCIWGVCDYNFN